MPGLLMFALFTLVFGGVSWFFGARQARLNRAMDSMDDSRRAAGYVGPNVPGPH